MDNNYIVYLNDGSTRTFRYYRPFIKFILDHHKSIRTTNDSSANETFFKEKKEQK